MDHSSHTYTGREIEAFITKEWRKSLPFLKKRYGISDDDCKDVFQEACIALHTNLCKGKLDSLTSSLSTYFTSICMNKAQEFLRKSARSVKVDSEMSLSLMDGDLQEGKINTILALDDDAETVREKKNELVRMIIRDLPSPCNEMLWGFYRDNLSMRALAEMFNYSSESSAKVTKHRCCEKFRARYAKLSKTIF